MVKNIVFDIGNVLADFKIKEFLFAKGYDEMMIKRIIKASAMSPYWGQFERAEITEDEAIKLFASQDPDIEDDLKEAFSNIEGMITGRDFAIPLVKALRDAGYRVYYLSNYSKKAYDDCKGSIEFMKYTEGGLLSFQVKMTKPDPNIYKLLLDKYQLQANETVFVDDTKENVDIAKELGFIGIVFESYEMMIEQFKDNGVKL